MESADTDEGLADLLIDGARYGDLEDVQQAIEQGAQVDWQDEQGRTALHMASANGHTQTVIYLLKAGAEAAPANKEGNTPLHFACLNGHVQVVQELTQRGASPSALNSHSQSPVDEALGRPHQDAIFQALDRALGAGKSSMPDDIDMANSEIFKQQTTDQQPPRSSQDSDELVIPNKYGPGS